MADDVKVTIGAESSGATSEFKRVGNELEKLRAKSKKAFFDLESDNKVKRNIGGMVQELVKAESATEAFAVALNRLENVFQSSIVAGIAVAGVGVLVNSIQNASRELEAFRLAGIKASEDIGRALSEGNAKAAFDQVGERLRQIEAQRKKEQTFFGSLTTGLAEAFSGTSGADKAQQRVSEQRTLDALADAAIQKQVDDERLAKAKEIAKAHEEVSREMAKQAAEDAAISDKTNAERVAAAKKYRDELNAAITDHAEAVKALAQQDETDTEKLNRLESEHADMLADQNLRTEAERERHLARVARMEMEIADQKKKVQAELNQQQEEHDARHAAAQAEMQLPAAKKAVADAEALMEQVQGQRQAAGDIGLFKRGASMAEQRSSQRFYQRQAEINAGVVARDEFRRKVGGDADKMAALKGEIEGRKQQILGQAGENNPEAILNKSKEHLAEIQKQITQLNNKLAKK